MMFVTNQLALYSEMNNLHHGFINKGSFEYKHAKHSATVDFYVGSMFIIYAVAVPLAVLFCDVIEPWKLWFILLQTACYLTIAWIFLRRYFVLKRTTYGLERSL